MTEYPHVIGEFETIRAVAGGMNLARYGDGELKIAYGAGYVREPVNAKLTEELRETLKYPNDGCLIGIPTMDPEGPKFESWTRHAARFVGAIDLANQYYSAFVSRPDSAPWIRVVEFGELVQSLWSGKRVSVVCERNGSIFDAVRIGALTVKHIECPHDRAYSVIDDLERAVCESSPEFVVLSAGPTATCLANRLARKKVHAIDMGSAGRFLVELLRGSE